MIDHILPVIIPEWNNDMKLHVDYIITIDVETKDEMDILVRGLQLIDWNDEETSVDRKQAIEMKGDLVAIRDLMNKLEKTHE